MIGFLRFVGVLNAAVWFGSAIFFTFIAGPSVFSEDMKNLLGSKYFPYYSGAIAEIILARYFQLLLICGVIAFCHVLGEWLYFGKSPRNAWVGLLAGLLLAALLGGAVIQPHLKRLHTTQYAVNTRPEEKEAAHRSFRVWHGTAQAINLLMLAGLGVYLWRMTNASEPTRFVSTPKFRS